MPSLAPISTTTLDANFGYTKDLTSESIIFSKSLHTVKDHNSLSNSNNSNSINLHNDNNIVDKNDYSNQIHHTIASSNSTTGTNNIQQQGLENKKVTIYLINYLIIYI